MTANRKLVDLFSNVGKYRIYWLFAAVFAVMSIITPNFLTQTNIFSIMKSTSTYAIVAIGFTIVMICGHLDLSFGSVLTLGAMLAIGLQPKLGWTGSLLAAALAGILCGLVNGVLVAKVKVNSFIATLGTMVIVQGLINIFSKGGTLFVDNFAFGDWLDKSFLLVLSPRVLLSIMLVVLFDNLLRRTLAGKGLYMVGANKQTAWFAGLNANGYIIGAFALAGFMSALGGSVFAASLSSANPTMGAQSLMLIIAAVIIGGTSMSGGKGSIFNSFIALLTLVALVNGLSCMGAGYEIQLVASGFVLAVIVLWDAYTLQKHESRRGRRPDLLKELAGGASVITNQVTVKSTYGWIVPIAVLVIVAGLATGIRHSGIQFGSIETHESTLKRSLAVNVDNLKSSDGQPLVIMDKEGTVLPERPKDPKALPETDALHWYNTEYAGWHTQKENLPKSPGNGAIGKRVICLRFMDHPYLTAYTKGMQQVADAYEIKLKTLVANNDINIQAQQVDQVINERPDLVIITPVDATAVVPLLRRLNHENIPVIASNLLPAEQGFKYILTWTGPADWGQFRMLARTFAKKMNYSGGYCIVRHMPGSSCFTSRTFGAVTELEKIAPNMKMLDMQATGLKAEKTMQVVSDWITRFGPELKGIVSADDSGAQIGINEACKKAHREDIVRVAAGHSKVGLDFVKSGELFAITYQSAESDGALPMKLAADWFNGKPIDSPIYYLPRRLIMKDKVKNYYPAQW